MTALDRPLFDVAPALRERIPWTDLGQWPTPVEPLEGVCRATGARELWIKRDDRSSPVYGGNKVRTLEVLFGEAIERGASHVYSTGAFGSNHATAAVLHAPRVGLESGVILFPQPRSWCALENLRVILSRRPRVRSLPHWSFLPGGMWLEERACRREGVRPYVMVPGGATPRGAVGYVSAALELGHQVAQSKLPKPSTIAVGVGSTCTSAGLLVGVQLAARLGIGWDRPPVIASIRVTPWPVTAHSRIVSLALRASELLVSLTGDDRFAFDRKTLGAGLEVDGRWLGRGYGHSTPSGRDAIAVFREHAGIELDTTYSGKSAAGAIEIAKLDKGPVVYWATKSTAPMPSVAREDWSWAPARIVRWIERCEREGLASAHAADR